LNRGGLANADVLLVHAEGHGPLIVKDYAQRSAPVRALLAPWLVRHELAMLQRACGLPGLPTPAGRIDTLALAMTPVAGIPLRRRVFKDSRPPAFFTALEGMLAGLAQRGLLYTDLRSPSNILVTPTGAPALVDMGSEFAVPTPRRLRAWLERRALRKLRGRFEGACESRPESVSEYDDVDLGRERLAVFDRGSLPDPVPALLLGDAGLPAVAFRALLTGAEPARRRALAVDLPGFGYARASRRRARPDDLAGVLLQLLDALRVSCVDVVGRGWGGRVAHSLARRAPHRVRRGLTFAVDTVPSRERVLAGLPATLSVEQRAEIESRVANVDAARWARVRRDLAPDSLAPPAGFVELDFDPLADPERVWSALAD